MVKDWKWLLAFVVALLGVFVAILPVKEYFFDGKSLAVWQLSEVAFQNKLNDWVDTEVKVGGKAIASPTLISIEVKNDGSKRIDKADWEVSRPLVIGFGVASPIEKYRVSEQTPSNLQPVIKLVSGHLEVAPLLLNKGDQFQLEILTSGEKPKLTVDARISDVTNPNIGIKKNEKEQLLFYPMLVFSVCIVMFGVAWLSALVAQEGKGVKVNEYLQLLLTGPFLLAGIAAMLGVAAAIELHTTQPARGLIYDAWAVLACLAFLMGFWFGFKKARELLNEK